MNIWRKIWISICRRKIKSFVLLTIVFILANVLLTTLAVTTSLKGTKEMVLKQFPPTISIDYNDKFDAKKTPRLSIDMIESLYNRTKDIVKNYDYALYLTMYKMKGIEEVIIDPEYSNVYGSLMVQGTQLSTTSLVEKGDAKLIHGKGFSEQDINEGSAKLMISKQFAELNQLDVGSYINLQRKIYPTEGMDGSGFTEEPPFFTENIDFEIVGVLEIKEVDEYIKKQEVGAAEDTIDLFSIQALANSVYAPNKFIHPIILDNIERVSEKYADNPFIQGVTLTRDIYPEFTLHDMKDLTKFTKEAKKIYNQKYYEIKSADAEYDAVAKPLRAMEDLMDIIFKICVAASIIVLTLVLYIFMYLRQKEIGIFLALGEHRKKVVFQVLMETLFIAMIGATLAICTSIIFSNMLTDHTITTLLTPTREINNTLSFMDASYGVSAKAISQQLQSGFGITTLLVFYGTMIISMILSQLASILYLFHLNPKKILM